MFLNLPWCCEDLQRVCCQNDEDVFLICMCCEDLQHVLNLHVL